jgi:hypothetical protein
MALSIVFPVLYSVYFLSTFFYPGFVLGGRGGAPPWFRVLLDVSLFLFRCFDV